MSAQVSLVGSRYTKPLGFSGGTFTLGGGGFDPDPAARSLSFRFNRKVAMFESADFKMTISLGTGLFEGTFSDPPFDQPKGFSGAVLQKTRTGGGLFKGVNHQTGFVDFDAVW